MVTELCDGLSLSSDREFVEPQSFSFSKESAHCCSDTQKNKVRRLTSESASDDVKKDDTAHTYAKFVHLL